MFSLVIFYMFVNTIIYLFRNLQKPADWLSPLADHSYTNVESTKRFNFDWFLLEGFSVVVLVIFSLGDGWYFSHNFSLVLSCTIFRRPSWHRHALKISAEFIFDIFWCDPVPHVPESLSDPIKKAGWIIYSYFL